MALLAVADKVPKFGANIVVAILKTAPTCLSVIRALFLDLFLFIKENVVHECRWTDILIISSFQIPLNSRILTHLNAHKIQ
jgi:hypothetical protein